jgi:hypothetical protein
VLESGSFSDDARIAFRPVGSVDRVQTHPTIADMDLQPIPVMLQFVRPAGATRRLRYDYGAAWMNESGWRGAA